MALHITQPINIDAIVKNGWDIDIIDAIFFLYIEYCIRFERVNVFIDPNYPGKWYCFDIKKTLEDIPILKTTTNTLYRRLDNLIRCGLIEKNPNPLFDNRPRPIRINKDVAKKYYNPE
jgi:hypothetical protein